MKKAVAAFPLITDSKTFFPENLHNKGELCIFAAETLAKK